MPRQVGHGAMIYTARAAGPRQHGPFTGKRPGILQGPMASVHATTYAAITGVNRSNSTRPPDPGKIALLMTIW